MKLNLMHSESSRSNHFSSSEDSEKKTKLSTYMPTYSFFLLVRADLSVVMPVNNHGSWRLGESPKSLRIPVIILDQCCGLRRRPYSVFFKSQ